MHPTVVTRQNRCAAVPEGSPCAPTKLFSDTLRQAQIIFPFLQKEHFIASFTLQVKAEYEEQNKM